MKGRVGVFISIIYEIVFTEKLSDLLMVLKLSGVKKKL